LGRRGGARPFGHTVQVALGAHSDEHDDAKQDHCQTSKHGGPYARRRQLSHGTHTPRNAAPMYGPRDRRGRSDQLQQLVSRIAVGRARAIKLVLPLVDLARAHRARQH
jgi:hypothetical protein